MESIEKLRESISAYAAECDEEWLYRLADEIEREIADKYMLLPVDCEGVPIHIGDYISCGSGEHDACGVIDSMEYSHGTWCAIDEWDVTFDWSRARHVKPRTIEDVLREYGELIANSASYPCNEDIRKYADELRGMGVRDE